MQYRYSYWSCSTAKYQILRRRYIEATESEIPASEIPASELREALATVKLYVQQPWDPGMISLVFEVVDEVAIAVQQDLHNLERRLATL